ncbi:zinc finger, CCHC-type containing protein [Tanacetum coccineum]|uniref:Zinc finger, CCHC-type containing protein n=1 Tax=Tanacetum coccineum TaxID=301880 RepID=A0ABQ5B112_9ASTR
MASINTRLNIEKLDGNIVQKHGGSKQVGFNQLGPGVETGVHGVQVEKRVWFEVELHRAQGDHEAEVFQVSNDDTAVAQRWLEDKSTQQCMKSVVAKHLGVVGIQQKNGLVDETNVTLFAKVRCFLIQSGLSKVFWAEDTTMSTYLVNRSPSSAIGFKTPVDMLGFFGWLASIKQGMLEPVKVKCIFLGYHKSIVGNKLWRLDDVTLKVLQGVEFEVEPQDDHTFEVEPHGNVDHVVGSQEVQTHDLIYYHPARDREQHSAWELFSYREDSNEAAFAVAAVDKVYAHESLTFNYTVASIVAGDAVTTSMAITRSIHQIWATKGLLDKAMENVLGMEIVRDQSGNTLRVSQSRFYNGKLVQTLLKGHSTLSLEDSLSGDYDVEKNGKWSYIYAVGNQEYQVVCTRPDIASAGVDMLDGFDRGLQTNVQVFVDFDYVMGRSITSMSRSIIRYGLLILGCAGSLKANLQHMEALSTTKAGIATGALVKPCSRSEVPTQVKVAAYRY